MSKIKDSDRDIIDSFQNTEAFNRIFGFVFARTALAFRVLIESSVTSASDYDPEGESGADPRLLRSVIGALTVGVLSAMCDTLIDMYTEPTKSLVLKVRDQTLAMVLADEFEGLDGSVN